MHSHGRDTTDVFNKIINKLTCIRFIQTKFTTDMKITVTFSVYKINNLSKKRIIDP
jgi:hypothetical protein